MNPLDYMLKARSVAIVGASERPGSVGSETVRQLALGGFTGDVYLINPRRDTIWGRPALGSLDEVETPVDLVVLAVANDRLEFEMEKVIKTGSRSVVVYASCHGQARGGGLLANRLATLATEAGVPICGGNGMGFVNLADGLRICGFRQPPDLPPGGISFLTHSGSMFSALLHNRRSLRFNLAVSTGLEANTTMDRYLDWALDEPSTRVIAMFLETIRNPTGLMAGLARARELGVPVVALKVGTSETGRRAVATHSGAIAGEDGVYEALFEAYGVHRVETVDEMADTLELLSAGRTATTRGLGAVHDSGGERALLMDTADRVGIPLPDIGVATIDRLASLLDPGLEPANPVDAWGTGRDASEVFVGAMTALADDPGIGALAFCVDLTTEDDPDQAYSTAAIEAHHATGKPVMVIANLTSSVDPDQADRLRRAGVPVLEGTETALRAVGHLFDRLTRADELASLPRLTEPGHPSSGIGDQMAALRVLKRYGIEVSALIEVTGETEALAAADAIGYPVVLKTRGHAHKTDIGGVVVGLADPETLVASYRRMSGDLGPDMLVCEQVPTGVELALGMVNDPLFGPVVVISAGGVLIEMLDDRVTLLPPVDPGRARRALDRLRLRPLLYGHRGSPPVDLDHLSEAISRFSELAIDAGETVGSIDVNPLIAGEGGPVAVDALMVGK